jgi:hypothetical protein
MKKLFIYICCIFITAFTYSQNYIPPQQQELVYIKTRYDMDYHVVWNDLTAQKNNNKRILVSIPTGSYSGLDPDMTWLNKNNLYFYLVGNEQITSEELKLLKKQNNIEQITFDNSHGDVSMIQKQYVLSHGVKLFRFDLQTGKFSYTGFILHNMNFAVSPDDTRLCTIDEQAPGNIDKLLMYNLNDGTIISHDIFKKTKADIDYSYYYKFQPYVFYDNEGHADYLQQTDPKLIWTYGVEHFSAAGTIDWQTCSFEWFPGFLWKKLNYYVSDGPLNVRSQPGKEGIKIFSLPQGKKILVTETGKIETIDGITAPWVRIWDDRANTGWVFSGYLKKIQ